ncbi:MAG TPA: GtrA family protein [Galbitalea sp.]|nr:GtrA family protein [Galbitalea sp.]
MTSPLLRIYQRIAGLLPRHFLAFGIVGFGGYLIDVGIFNALRLGLFGEHNVTSGPIVAKIISVAVATLGTWFGNRYFAFRDKRRSNVALELLEFSAVAIAGNGIALLCLYLSHYIFGLTSLLADNISTNVIGLVLATTFRFLLYRLWVYAPHRADSLAHVRLTQKAAEHEAASADRPIG